MDIKHILSMVDHTLLKPETTWEQIKGICDGVHPGLLCRALQGVYAGQSG